MNHLHGSTAIAGITCYDADQFPKEYFRNMFVGNPVTHRVNRDTLTAHGSSFEAVEDPDFIVCDDPWFRPVEIKLGPDGALYIGDFYNCIIGHYEVPLDHPMRDRERGRIWHVVYKGKTNESSHSSAPRNLATADVHALVAALADPNITVRTLATQELVNRIGAACVPIVSAQVRSGKASVSQRAHGIWVLERLGELDDELVRQLLDDPDRTVRVHLIKALAERGEKPSTLPIAALVRAKLADKDAFVRRAAADCLGRHRELANVEPLLELWRSTPAEDPQLIHTIRMALRDHLKLSEIMAAVSNSDGKLGLSVDDHKRLAELCLGIPTPAAADLALTYLKENPGAVTDLGSATYALMRNASASRLNDVYDLALSYRKKNSSKKKRNHKDDQGQEQVLLLGLQRAAQERGVTLPDSINNWAKEFTFSLLNSKNGSARDLGIELAEAMKLREAESRIATIALTDIGSDLRIDAIMASVAIDGPASVEMLGKVLNNQKEELALRQRAARRWAPSMTMPHERRCWRSSRPRRTPRRRSGNVVSEKQGGRPSAARDNFRGQGFAAVIAGSAGYDSAEPAKNRSPRRTDCQANGRFANAQRADSPADRRPIDRFQQVVTECRPRQAGFYQELRRVPSIG